MCNLGFEFEFLDERQTFYRNLLAGHFHKDLIRVILEESEYEVYPYGYESFLTPLKIKFEKGEIKQTEISKKIRSTPDLLVYDPENKTVELLEVKSRRWDRTDDVLIKALPKYQKYWRDSILVIVLPAGHFFYAQRVSDLESKTADFDMNKEFMWFEEIFTKINLSTLYSYKKEVINFWGRNQARYEPLGIEPRFSLYNLIEEIRPCSIDKLFEEQNKRNLISREVFEKTIKELIDEGKIKEKKGKIL